MESKYKITGEFKQFVNKSDILFVAANTLSLIKPASVKFILYTSPKKNEQKYFIIFSTQDKENIETFKSIVGAFTEGNITYSDKNDIDDFLFNNIYPIKKWEGFFTKDIKEAGAISIFEKNNEEYSNLSRIQILDINNINPNNKLKNLLDKTNDEEYDKLNIAAGFFWSESEDLSYKKNPVVNKLLSLKSDKNNYIAVDKIPGINQKLYPISNWITTKNNTIPIKLKNGITTGFDIFRNTSYQINGTIIGQTGKTSLIKHIAYSHHTKGDNIFIFPLEDQDNYTELLKTTKGKEIILDPDNPVSINPFSFFKGKDDLLEIYGDYFIEWIFIMSIKNNTVSIPEKEEKYIKFHISKAFTELYKIHKEKLTVKIIYDFMKQFKDKKLSSFLNNLNSFIKTYDKFFNYKSEINFNNPLTVINTYKIDNYNQQNLLNALITAMLINIEISRYKEYKESIIFIDNFHKLIDNMPQTQYYDTFLFMFLRRRSSKNISTIFATKYREKNRETLIDFIKISNWIFITSNPACENLKNMLPHVIKKTDIEKAIKLKQEEILLINKCEKISEFFKYNKKI